MLEEKQIRTVLVTGATGQLANEIKELSLAYSGFKFLFTSRQELSIEDYKDVESFFQNQTIHYCINCAAYTAVDKAEGEKESAFLINAEAVGNLAKVCKSYQVKFIHISTDYVYNSEKGIPLKETDAVGPVNVYGSSKLKGEELAINHNPTALVIRTSWVYSSFGYNFVKTMLHLFAEKDQLNVVSDQVGCPTYAADLAKVIMKFIQQIESGKDLYGIYNYSNSGITNWYEFALAIKEISNSQCTISPVSSSEFVTPARRPLYSVMDTSKLKEALQIEIPFWKESLKKCLAKLL
ncbi:MAG: dTDP-4-dehydrorhamnose reductase [Ginsengibacter sp.]